MASSPREQIVPEDIESTANTISKHRLSDLVKEYSAILPGLSFFTSAFIAAPHELKVVEAYERIENTLSLPEMTPIERQTFELLRTPSDIAAGLYSVGFLGLKDPITGVVAFCHDGRLIDREIKNTEPQLYTRATGER